MHVFEAIGAKDAGAANSPLARSNHGAGCYIVIVSDRTLNATLSFPVFDGLRAKSNVDLARAQARIADLQLQQERENVAIEVARAALDLPYREREGDGCPEARANQVVAAILQSGGRN